MFNLQIPLNLQILLIDDDEFETDAMWIRLQQLLGGDNFDWTWVSEGGNTYEAGRTYLKDPPNVYDLVLIDVHLGDAYPWGGRDLRNEFAQNIRADGRKLLLYSSYRSPLEAFGGFDSEEDGFVFADRNSDEFVTKIIKMLRLRTRHLALSASPHSAVSVKDNASPVIEIKGQEWSVNSLLAPWLATLPGEVSRSRESVIATLFGGDMIRVFSKLYKGQAFAWPSEKMYGLAAKEYHHVGNKVTGAMDALTHPSFTPQNTNIYRDAAQDALSDLDSLRGLDHILDPDFLKDLQRDIETAGHWDACPHSCPNTPFPCAPEQCRMQDTMEAMQRRVRFTLLELIACLRPHSSYIPNSTIPLEDLENLPFYCPGVAGAQGEFRPALIVAAEHLRRSVEGHSTGDWEVDLSESSGRLFVQGEVSQELPTVQLAICYTDNAPKPDISIENWFIAGHDLGHALAALRGCAQWHVLVGDGRDNLQRHYPPNALTEAEAQELYKTFARYKNSQTVHVLRMRFPAVKPL